MSRYSVGNGGAIARFGCRVKFRFTNVHAIVDVFLFDLVGSGTVALCYAVISACNNTITLR